MNGLQFKPVLTLMHSVLWSAMTGSWIPALAPAARSREARARRWASASRDCYLIRNKVSTGVDIVHRGDCNLLLRSNLNETWYPNETLNLQEWIAPR